MTVVSQVEQVFCNNYMTRGHI